MLVLKPVVEAPYGDLPFEWSVQPKHGSFVELSGDVPDEVFAFFLAILADYNELARSGTIDDVAKLVLQAEELILPGGLSASADGVEIHPSCCCGLEGWREWLDIEPEGGSPWLGHDPWPWVECRPDRAVIWADENPQEDMPNIVVSYAQLGSAIRAAETRFVAFFENFEVWLSRHTSKGPEATRHIAKKLDLPLGP